MDQADDNSLTARLTKREQVRFCEIVNTCTERWEEKRIQRMAWILSHVVRKTLCEHVNGLCPAGWLNERSITKHWFQSVRTCPYSYGHWPQQYHSTTSQGSRCDQSHFFDSCSCSCSWKSESSSCSGAHWKFTLRKLESKIYFATWGKITAWTILPLANMDEYYNVFSAGKQVVVSFLCWPTAGFP